MKHLFLLMHCVLLFCFGYCQKKQVDLLKIESSILEEGTKLYRIETAQTQGLQAFRQQLSKLADTTEGYFAYKDGSLYKCVFFNKMFDAQIIATVTFDSTFNPLRTSVNTINRPMNWKEKDLCTIRRRAIDDIKSDTAFYKLYNTTWLSLIAIAEGTDKKVYVATRSADAGVIVFGNDYLLEFNSMSFLSSKKALHKKLIPVEIPEGIVHPENVASSHKEEQEYMSPTDICTILLYRNKANWQNYVVKTNNFVTIWYGDTNELQIVPRHKWDKYNKGADNSDDDDEPVASTIVKKP